MAGRSSRLRRHPWQTPGVTHSLTSQADFDQRSPPSSECRCGTARLKISVPQGSLTHHGLQPSLKPVLIDNIPTRCACRKCHPCWSGRVVVFVEDACPDRERGNSLDLGDRCAATQQPEASADLAGPRDPGRARPDAPKGPTRPPDSHASNVVALPPRFRGSSRIGPLLRRRSPSTAGRKPPPSRCDRPASSLGA
jgi:hypothetical protein